MSFRGSTGNSGEINHAIWLRLDLSMGPTVASFERELRAANLRPASYPASLPPRRRGKAWGRRSI
eukprot:2263805-Pleurochrysis_carterae.AAC.1